MNTRRDYLHCLAAFLRWLELTAPGHDLWTVTEDVLVAYKDQIATATGPAAHLLRAAGLPTDQVQELVGHADPRTTTRYRVRPQCSGLQAGGEADSPA